ncbi:MAG: MFS transporter [Ferruginibacter sp.]
MKPTQYSKPFYIFFLMMPTGISNGFVTVALPFLLTKNGFPVATTAAIVALGLSANLWRFLWGPIVDISLTARKWFLIGLIACIVSLLAVCIIPFTIKGTILLSMLVFVSQVAATLIVLPINGIMAHRITADKKGLASGWFQAGSLAGTGLGGGVGLWLSTHYNAPLAGVVLCGISLLFALVILLIKDIAHGKGKTLLLEVKGMGKDIFTMIKSPVALAVMILMLLPIGTGAMSGIWSAIAEDWKTDADTVVLVTGLLSGLVSAVGCVAGGIVTDRWGVWKGYLGCGVICAAITTVIALIPYIPVAYTIGVLAYAFGTGMIYASFTATILFAIGKKNVATKYSLIASIGNLPVVYMTAFNGWIHDKYNSKVMLLAEAALGILFVLLFFLALKYLMQKRWIPIQAKHVEDVPSLEFVQA